MAMVNMLMKVLSFSLMISRLSVAHAHGWMEFGRERPADDKFLQRKRLVRATTRIVDNLDGGTYRRRSESQRILEER